MPNDKTTIWVDRSTRDMIARHAEYGDSLDSAINKIANLANNNVPYAC